MCAVAKRGRDYRLPFKTDVTTPDWKRGFDDGRSGSVCADTTNVDYFDGWLRGDQERKHEEETPGECGACCGSGREVWDPDIGTDRECPSCDGTGVER